MFLENTQKSYTNNKESKNIAKIQLQTTIKTFKTAYYNDTQSQSEKSKIY